jgi:Uncharacterized protein conserved in bacteria
MGSCVFHNFDGKADTMLSDPTYTVLFIFLARCVDVTIGVFRLLMVVKGRRIIAACLGFFEVMVFISVMNIIMGGGKTLSFPELVAYCSGYATGNIVGSFLETKLMDAYVLAEIIAEQNEHSDALVGALREAGFGTTVIMGEGRSGPRLVIKVICSRKHQKRVKAISDHYGSFLIISDVKGVSGGYFRSGKRK